MRRKRSPVSSSHGPLRKPSVSAPPLRLLFGYLLAQAAAGLEPVTGGWIATLPELRGVASQAGHQDAPHPGRSGNAGMPRTPG